MLTPYGQRGVGERWGALAGFRHQRLTLPDGPLGTWGTLRHMRRFARDGAAQTLTRRAAAAILQSIPQPLRDGRGRATALRDFLARRFRFVADPEGVEYLQTPSVMLSQLAGYGMIEGDCDDAAILGGALGRALQLPARFRAVAFPLPNSPYRHVIADVRTPRGWHDLDVTKPAQMIPPTFSRIMTMEV